MTTFLEVKQDVLRELSKRDASIAMLTIPGTTTLQGTSTLLNDDQLGAGTTQANRYDGRQIEIVELISSPATGPNVGEIARVNDAGFDLVDGLTLSPALNNAVQTAGEYLIYPLGLSKHMLEGALNEVFRETQGPHLYFPSLIADAELDGTLSANWTDVGTPSTPTEYVVTAAQVLLGERSLHFVADAGDEGFSSNSIPVDEGETVLVAVNVKALVGSVTVQLYNASTSASIKEVTVNEPNWTEVRFSEAIPDDCENIQLRILSDAAADDVLMSAHPIFQIVGSSRLYSMPDWLKSEAQIMGWVRIARGVASETADSFVAFGKVTQFEHDVNILRDVRAVHPFYLELEPDDVNSPVGLIAQREFAEVTLGGTVANPTTIPMDRAYARSAAIAKILRGLGDDAANGWARAARVRAEQVGYGSRDLIVEPTPTRAM